MEIFPAIDIIDGKVVRLFKGDYGAKTEYGNSVIAQAEKFYEVGAKNLHLVDLDGAKSGKIENDKSILEVAKTGKFFIELGGGIRSYESEKYYLDNGVNRIILGTSALKDKALLKRLLNEFGEKISVGVDAKNGLVAISGWLDTEKIDSVEFCEEMRDLGVSHIIYTDISKDGTLSGTNLEIYERLSKIKGLKITASGGITYLHEIEQLRKMELYGAILGKALYENKLDLKECLKASK